MAQFEFGWAGIEAERDALEKDGQRLLQQFRIIGATEIKRMMLPDFVKKLKGTHLKNIPQPVGDCVSRGVKNAVDHLAATEIVRLGQAEEFKETYSPYYYSLSRNASDLGNGRFGRQHGSLGVYGAGAAQKYGSLEWTDDRVYNEATCNKYAFSLPPESEITLGKVHKVRAIAQVRTPQEIAEALCNGYPCTIASMQGYNMQTRQKDGKSWFVGSDTWAHQLSILAVDITPVLCFLIQNSWGDNAHGDQLDGPPGSGWVTEDQLKRHLARDAEAYAFSDYDGFPAKEFKWFW